MSLLRRDVGSPVLLVHLFSEKIARNFGRRIFKPGRCYARSSDKSITEPLDSSRSSLQKRETRSSSDVNSRTPLRVFLSLSQDFVRHGSRIALAEGYVLE